MQNNKTAAAAAGKRAAAATLNFGPKYSPELFQNSLSIARRNIALVWNNDPRRDREFCAEIDAAAGAEYPTDAFPLSKLGRKYSAVSDCWPLLYVSNFLFKAGQTAGPLDFFKFRGFIASARAAINRGALTLGEFSAREFWFRESPDSLRFYGFGNYYRAEIPGTKNELFTRKRDSLFCPFSGQYFPDTEAAYFKSYCAPDGSVGNGAIFAYHVWDRAFSLSPFPFVYFGEIGAYIFENEMALFDAVLLQDSGDIVHSRNAHQHPDGLYYSRPFGIVCSPNDAVAGYHSGAGRPAPVRFSRNNSILTGWEIEKEDYRVKCGISHRDFCRALPGFRKERDGSLDGDSGFEFITPPLELSPRSIQSFFESRPVALAHINADFSAKCGGHVHISKPGYSGLELFDEIAGYLPLFYALFPRRADGPDSYYCKAKTAAALISDREKYQAINILQDRIEIRIFGAVKGLENLVWRAGLLKKIFARPCAANETRDFFYGVLPGLFCHLKKVYSTPADMERIINRIAKYCGKFGACNISPRRDFERGLIPENVFLKFQPATGRATIKALKKSNS